MSVDRERLESGDAASSTVERRPDAEMERLRLLRGVAGELLAADDPRPVVRRLAERVGAHLGCDVFFSFLVDPRERMIRLLVVGGVDDATGEALARVPLGELVCGKVALEGRRRVLSAIDRDAPPEAAGLCALGLRAYVCSPLKAGDRVLGTLSFGSRNRQAFTGDELGVVQEVVDLVSLAFERFEARQRDADYRDQLRAARETFERHFQNCPAAIIESDARGRYVRWSTEAERIFGFPASEVLGRHWLDVPIVHDADLPAINDLERRIHAGEVSRQVQFARNVTRDGRFVWCEWYNSVLTDAQGRVQSILSFVLDVTDRVESERQAGEARERLALAQRSGRVGVFDWDLDTGTVHWTPELESLFGLAPGSFEGTFDAWRRRAHPDDVADIERRLRLAVERRDAELEYEFRARRPDGAELWLMGKGSLFFHPDSGRLVRMIGVNVDITDRKRWEQQLDRARHDAEEASRAKDHFLAVLSHELRTPLTPVLAASEAVEHDPRLPRDLRELVTVIRRNVALEARLIDDLLDLTRITRGKLELHRCALDLAEATRDAVRTVAHDARAKGVELLLTAADNAPATIDGDPARVQQVVWNLVKNAVKFTPPGGRVTVATSRSGPNAVVEVIDTGIGFTADAASRIFGAFEQADRDVARRFGGLGLGLAISRALVEAHGGSVTAHSPGPGLGATFRVELPACTDPAAPPCPPPDADTPYGPRIPVTVLLVDDHIDTARVMSRLLTALGYRVRTADCVAGALAAFRAFPADVLVSDIGLPDGTGHDLLRTLFAEGLCPRCAIALSGFGMDTDVRTSLDTGFSRHLTKPVDATRLHHTIRELGVGS